CMLATVVVVCPSGSSVSASMPTAIVIDVGAAASPPVGTPDSATPAAHTRATASGGLICLRLIVVLPPLCAGTLQAHPRPAFPARRCGTLLCRPIPLLPLGREAPPAGLPGRGGRLRVFHK